MMKKKSVLIFFLMAIVILSVSQSLRADDWDTGGVGSQPPQGGIICDNHNSNGSCLYSVQASSSGQAWRGHFSANFIGSSGVIGPGNATVTGCLSENTVLFSDGSSCWFLYNRDLRNSSDTFSDTGQFNIGTDPVPKFKYWVVNIYGNESFAYNILYSVDSRLVEIKDFKADKVVVKTGQKFTVSWDTKNVFDTAPQISWTGSIQNIDTPQDILPNIPGSKTFTAGSTSGTATITLSNVCGPSANGRICLDPQSISITVTSPPAPPPPGQFSLNPTSCQGNGFFNLSWTSSSNAATYNIFKRRDIPGYGWESVVSGLQSSTTTYTTQESTGVHWFFYIEAVNSAGKTNSTPGPPEGLYGGSCPATSQVPTCVASPATVKKNDATTISAGGGNGTYSWSGGGSPATGTGPTFTTSWSTDGTKTVTVTSAGNSGFCTVEVTKGPSPVWPPPTCAASPTTVFINQNTTFTGGSGDGTNYSWFEGATLLGIGQTMTNSWPTPGTKNVTVSSGGNSGACPPITVNSVSTGGTTNVIGFLDRPSTSSDCDLIGGWAVDQDHKADSIAVVLNWAGGGWVGSTDVYRPDVNAETGATGNHGFNISTPASLKDGQARNIYAYGVDADTGNQVGLNGSPKSLTCGAQPPPPSGTVQITSNKGGIAFFLRHPGGEVIGDKVDANGNKTYTGYELGTYAMDSVEQLSGYTSSVNPTSATLTSGQGISFKIIYSDKSQPPPPPPPGSASASCTVNVGAPTPPPPVPPNNPSGVSAAEPNYCVSGPAATVNWTYSDPAGSPQSAYQVQIDDKGSFNSPEWDSGKVSCSGCRSNSTTQGLLQFNTTYRARVRTWNQNDAASDWAVSNSWKTPPNAFPQVNFVFSPNQPASNVPVQFTDQTQFFDGNPNGRRWSWLFGNGGSSTQQNPVKSYANEGNYNVTLSATDNTNQSCSISKPINIRIPNPIWKEVNPGG